MRLKYIQFVGGWWNVAALTTFCEMTVFQPKFHCTERGIPEVKKGDKGSAMLNLACTSAKLI